MPRNLLASYFYLRLQNRVGSSGEEDSVKPGKNSRTGRCWSCPLGRRCPPAQVRSTTRHERSAIIACRFPQHRLREVRGYLFSGRAWGFSSCLACSARRSASNASSIGSTSEGSLTQLSITSRCARPIPIWEGCIACARFCGVISPSASRFDLASDASHRVSRFAVS